MTSYEKLEIINESLINGQRRQMVEQIDRDFTMYDFWELYHDYLRDYYPVHDVLKYFADAVISYHRIKGE